MPLSLTPIINLGGQPLSDDWMEALVEVRVDAEFQLPARAVLRLLERDTVGGSRSLIEDSVVDFGSDVEITAHNPEGGADVKLFKGELTSITANAVTGGLPELVLTAHDKSHRLSRTTNIKAFTQVKVSDVVSQLASSAGLHASVDATSEVFPWMIQPDTDLGMLTELARRTGYDWWVDDATLHFAKPGQGRTIGIEMYRELISFSVRLSGHHPSAVKVQGWDQLQKTAIVGQSDQPSEAVLATSPLAKKGAEASSSLGEAVLITSALTPASQSEAESVSQAVLDRAASAAVAVRGTCVDAPAIALGTAVEVSGVSEKLAGKYPVTKVEHVFRAGTPLTTKFNAGDRTSHSLVETLAGAGVSRSPAFRYDGLVVGVVTNAQDNENLGRVKVKFPSLSGEVESWWARVVNVGGGQNRGGGYQPEVDDEVLVGFENGDTRRPVVFGGLYNTKDAPPALKYTSAKKLAERTVTSRRGHVFSVIEGDDDPTAAAFLLQLAGDKGKVHLAANGATIEMPRGQPVTMKSGSSSVVINAAGDILLDSSGNITIKTSSGNVSIEGLQVKIAAQTELNMQGQSQASLKATMVTVEGQATAAVKGGMVQIN